MSHKASHWLADIAPEQINASAFRVLFHLCDAHNAKRPAETACFPSQEMLRAVTGLSNGGLNNALNAIEAAGLMRRRRTRSADGTRGPTFYILGCDFDDAQEQTPENGDGTISNLDPEPSPFQAPNHLHVGGVEPVRGTSKGTSKGFSDFWNAWPKKEAKGDAEKAWKAAVRQASPERIIAGIATSPQVNREKKFIPSAGKWLRNKGWEDDAPQLRAVPSASDADLRAKRVEFIKSGKDYLTRNITATQARELIEAGLVTPDECRKAGVSC